MKATSNKPPSRAEGLSLSLSLSLSATRLAVPSSRPLKANGSSYPRLAVTRFADAGRNSILLSTQAWERIRCANPAASKFSLSLSRLLREWSVSLSRNVLRTYVRRATKESAELCHQNERTTRASLSAKEIREAVSSSSRAGGGRGRSLGRSARGDDLARDCGAAAERAALGHRRARGDAAARGTVRGVARDRRRPKSSIFGIPSWVLGERVYRLSVRGENDREWWRKPT